MAKLSRLIMLLLRFIIVAVAFIVLQMTNISYAKDVEWGTFTRKDQLTGEVGNPFLFLRKSMTNVSGDIQVEASCQDKNAYNASLNVTVKFFHAPSLLVIPSADYSSYYTKTRIYLRSKKVQSSYPDQDANFSNVFRKQIVTNQTDFDDLPLREEFTFSNNQKYILNYDDSFLKYAQECFAGRICYTREGIKTNCS